MISFFNSLRDTFGQQVLEAMAPGLPVVCLDLHGGGTFVPKEAGIIVPVRSPSETRARLAKAVVFLWQNPEYRISAGKQAFRFAQKHRLENKWNAFLDILVKEMPSINHKVRGGYTRIIKP